MGTKSKHKKNSAKQKELKTVEIETKADANVSDIGLPEVMDTTIVSMAEEANDVKQEKTYRKRKKHYYNAIRAQMEFYLGDANLNKDRFLKQLIDKDPYIPLDVFLTFNMMKALTSNIEDIAKSLSNSILLELDESQLKVKRKIPMPENRNVDEKTLYVEALPSTADHEWVRQIFERFGKVAYISLPRYMKSRKIKEFGFVEFEKEDSVNKAIKTFKEFNGVLSLQEKDPSELVSVTSYIKEHSEKEDPEETTGAADSRKRSHSDISIDETENKSKKWKMDSQESKSLDTEKDISSQSGSEIGAQNTKDKLEDSSKKKKRLRKKKTSSNEKLTRKAELNTDVAYYELKILPKKDWKRLRNKYLNLQREKVSELKRRAWREQQDIKNQKDSSSIEEKSTLPPGQQEQNKSSKSSAKHKLQKMNMNFYGAAEEEPSLKVNITEKISHQNPALERAPLFSYEPGLIVEVTLLEPCVNIKEFKADMRQYNSVKYTDIKEGSLQAYLRLESSQKALDFVNQINSAEYQCKILSDEAEINYWKKIEKDREEKLNKQVKITQKRGREKIKKLISKHIRFGDDDV